MKIEKFYKVVKKSKREKKFKMLHQRKLHLSIFGFNLRSYRLDELEEKKLFESYREGLKQCSLREK